MIAFSNTLLCRFEFSRTIRYKFINVFSHFHPLALPSQNRTDGVYQIGRLYLRGLTGGNPRVTPPGAFGATGSEERRPERRICGNRRISTPSPE
ncbi:unnamed protein product [Nesidiocoris tenuis]|uniref:Uncharacterized protein n=1 Tax=Nesidiocoris tenuis TaxID=355587 RepID=A0A6H5GDZ0_9HEMI|nr:unnamed protein product [Nesidiocoris tenuis]